MQPAAKGLLVLGMLAAGAGFLLLALPASNASCATAECSWSHTFGNAWERFLGAAGVVVGAVLATVGALLRNRRK